MNKTYIPALISLAALAVIHKIASAEHWYIRFPGTDIFMHILGGIGLAFSVYWILVTFLPEYFKPGKDMFWIVVGSTFFLGLCWEIMEAVNDIAGAPFGTTLYYLDTSKDLVNDTLGAIIATFFLKK